MDKLSAGIQLKARTVHVERNYVEYSTGFRVVIPEKHLGLVFPPRDIASTGWSLCSSVEVLDSNFCGELKLRFYPVVPCTDNRPYSIGDEIGQLVILSIPDVEFEMEETWSEN